MTHSSYTSTGPTQIPTTVLDRLVLWNEGGIAFWVDNIRVFTDGITFTLRTVISVTRQYDLGLEIAPELVDHAADTDPIRLLAVVDDAAVWGAYTADAPPPGENALELVSAGAQPGIGFAEWWLPEVPSRSLAFKLDYRVASAQSEETVDASSWAALARAGNVALGGSADQ